MKKTEIPFTQEYVINNLEEYLIRFFNVLWGSSEHAYQKIESLKHTIQNQIKLPLLHIFIDQYPEIAIMKGWKDSSLLASAISINSWITQAGEKYDEYIVLLSLFKFFTELGVEDERTELFRYEVETIIIEKDLI